MQNLHYIKHLSPIYSVKRFLKIHKPDIHCISMFQTSLTQCPHHSNCISRPTSLSESKLTSSQQMFCLHLNSLCQDFQHNFRCMTNEAYCSLITAIYCISLFRHGCS